MQDGSLRLYKCKFVKALLVLYRLKKYSSLPLTSLGCSKVDYDITRWGKVHRLSVPLIGSWETR